MAENWEVSKKITRKRWLTATVILCMIPLIYPFMLPIPVSDRTRAFHDQIDALPPGSVLVWGESAADVSTYTNFRTFYWALWDTLCENEIKVIFTSWNTGAHLCGLRAAEERDIEGRYGYEYGKDYVIMPYLTGQEMAMASIAGEDGFINGYSIDALGNPIGTLPIFQEVRDFSGVDLILISYSATEYGPMMIRQWGIKWDIPSIVIGQFYAIGEFYGIYVWGNIDRMLAMAEFEYLVGIVGEEILRMTMRDLQAWLVIAMLFVGFVWYIVQRTSGVEEQTGGLKREL